MRRMKSSRATQPYRKGRPRQAGLAFNAMKAGRSAFGQNPVDLTRDAGKAAKRSFQPVGPTKGTKPPLSAKAAKPGAFSAFTLHKNATSNARAGQTFRTVAGTSKSGVEGNYHVYADGTRVFVADKGAKPLRQRARDMALKRRGGTRMSG
jgi:hypothetical protein